MQLPRPRYCGACSGSVPTGRIDSDDEFVSPDKAVQVTRIQRMHHRSCGLLDASSAAALQPCPGSVAAITMVLIGAIVVIDN